MRHLYRWCVVATAMVALAAVTGAVDIQPAVPAPTVDVSTLGPQPGQQVPDFALPDQRGARRTLDSLMGQKGLVLVFSRSVDW